MADDTELYIHDDDGYDELFALIENDIVNPILAGDAVSDALATIVDASDSQSAAANESQLTENTDSQTTVVSANMDVVKLSYEVVSELNRRIARLTVSPFQRFRGSHRGFGVRPILYPS